MNDKGSMDNIFDGIWIMLIRVYLDPTSTIISDLDII